MEEKISIAVSEIMDIINKVASAAGNGGDYNGDPREDVTLILQELVVDTKLSTL